jgi:hypothetical protein
MTTLILVFAAVFCLELILVLMLTLMPKLGGLGKDIIGAFTQTPWLDLLLSIMLWIPWLASVIIAGWSGLFSALLAQFIFMQLWCFIHELAHSDYRFPRTKPTALVVGCSVETFRSCQNYVDWQYIF